MNSYLTTHFVIAMNALILAVIVGISGWYIDMQGRNLERALTSHVDETVMRITTLAELTDRNGADEITERVSADCPRREEFEGLLSRLASLQSKELLATQQMFESCGSFYAERKAIMVSHLKREYEALVTDLNYLKVLRDLKQSEVVLFDWSRLIEYEEKRSEFLREQTELQADILTLLIHGEATKEVSERAAQAQNVAESLRVVDAEIDSLRASLIP